ncbi:MAG: hypothetical protein ACMG6H_14365 [Acidobacteriota bacterium]
MKQYQILVDTYKSYLDLVLKFILFSYAVTGSFLSFYLSHSREGIMRFGLVFPIIMNALFTALSFLAASRVKPLSKEVERVTNELSLQATPDIDFLATVLLLLGVLFGIITCGLVIISFARK